MTWERLRESEIKDSGSMLPARMVLEYDQDKGTYRTFLETFKSNGESGFQYGRHFETKDEATEDFQIRSARLQH